MTARVASRRRTWVAPGRGAGQEVTVPGLSEALAVGLTEAGWWVIGTDATCRSTAWSSVSRRRDRRGSTATAAGRRLVPGPGLARSVRSPRGPVELASGCEATWVQAVGQQVYAVCADGRALSADRTTRQFVPIDGAEPSSPWPPPRRRHAGAVDDDIRVRRGAPITVDGRGQRRVVHQRAARSPLGVAWTGDTLVAQVDTDLLDQSTRLAARDSDVSTRRERRRRR